jgi:hypothetical protein
MLVDAEAGKVCTERFKGLAQYPHKSPRSVKKKQL